MKKLWLPLLAATAFVAVAIAGWFWKQTPHASRIACPDPVAGCTFLHNGLPTEVRFSKLPIALEPFGLSLVAPGVRRASAEFQMAGMDMGFNRHDLRPVPGNRFAGQVALPACVTGSHRWEAQLVLDGSRYTFTFNNGDDSGHPGAEHAGHTGHAGHAGH